MRTRTLAHLSDLHFGRSRQNDEAAVELFAFLRASDIDDIVVSGDITHRGRRSELEQYELVAGPLLRSGRLTVVPGNHDRLSDDVAGDLMFSPRVQVERRDGLHMIRVDSTGLHNRSHIVGHGEISSDDLEVISALAGDAPAGALVATVVHHHLVPLPGDCLSDRLAGWLGQPWAAELAAGAELLDRLRGRCDVVFHGHRHAPCEINPFPNDARPVRIYNAGASPRLGGFRLFTHRAGQLLAPPEWVQVDGGIAIPAAAAALRAPGWVRG